MRPLPPAYAWLPSVIGLPRMVSEALKLYGTLETPGTADNPAILGWAKEVGLDHTYSDDSIPWCGLFCAVVAKRAGKVPPVNPLWALNWAKFGIASPQPGLGDVLVMKRKTATGTAGHVTIYCGEDALSFHGIGGNQSDAVTIDRFLRSRIVAIRRPIYKVQPMGVRPVRLAATGSISNNES